MHGDGHREATLPVFGQISEEIRELLLDFVLLVLNTFPVVGCREDEEEKRETEEIEENRRMDLQRACFNRGPQPQRFVVHVGGDAVLIVNGHVEGDGLEELSFFGGHEDELVSRIW